MKRTEQIGPFRCLLALIVLALAAPYMAAPSLCAAQKAQGAAQEAETAADAAQAEAEDSQPEDTPSEEPKVSESEATDPEAAAPDSKPAEDASEKKSESADEQPTDQPAEDQPKETKAVKDEPTTMNSNENSNDNETSDSKEAVETERELEVEPAKADLPVEPTVPPTQAKLPAKKKRIIGATATLLEKQSGIQFSARVDSGAKSCSLHVENFKIENESKKENIVERMRENIGKVIHFEVKNGEDKTHILTSKIAGYVIIKTSDKQRGKRRYKVPLTFRWKSMEKEVLVTLNNRNHMEYPLLLGRNFLRGDFLVDVELNSDD